MNRILNKKITLSVSFILSLLAFAAAPALVNAASMAGASQGSKAQVNFMPYAKEFSQAYALVYGSSSMNNYLPPLYSSSVLDPYASSRSLQSLASTSFYRLYLNAWSVSVQNCGTTDTAAFGLKTTTNKCVGFSANNTLTGESFTNPGFIYSTTSSINWAAVVGTVIIIVATYFLGPIMLGVGWSAIGASIAAGWSYIGLWGHAVVYGIVSRVAAP